MTRGWFSPNTPLIIAHRGLSAEAPENTLAAFSLAADIGADGVELDVQLSADGRPVIFHDSTLERLANRDVKVSDLTVAELKELDLGMGQTVPTLNELFETLGKRLLYNIELKSFHMRDRGLETAVAGSIEAFHLQNHVLISSFNPLSVRRARRALPHTTPVALLRYRAFWKYTYILASGEADHPHYSLVDEEYMAWARGRKYRINVWTVDDPREAQRLAKLGVHGIITRKPRLIRNSIAR